MSHRFLTPWQGLAYGALGLPLAFVALPLYVLLPHHYASQYGVSLAALGGVLWLVRLLDAVADPWIGRWLDTVFRRSHRLVWHRGLLAGSLLALALVGLFLPPVRSEAALLLWVVGALSLTSLAYSVLSIAHHSWGARLGGNEAQRGQVVAWREGPALVGVVLASILPTVAGIPAMLVVFALLLALALWAWRHGPHPHQGQSVVVDGGDWRLPWRRAPFRALVAVFVLNGMASAIPATLVLFFVQDRLQAPASTQPLFLGGYFVMAALGLPAWLAGVRRWGLVRVWALGMLVSVAVFAWAQALGSGDVWAFAVVCLLSGLALGADLALPGALLVGVMEQAGDREHHASAYLGWWQFATKLNLAAAAGLALPLLSWWGYTPGTTDADGLQALSWAYAVLPCGLKLLALLGLWRWVRPSVARGESS